ncbi:hypothetical protein N7526_011442 [Penicillium atrosanguineum]|nr:hypothetical protein N7526_011442 [Penicillium atrosanguineum]
MKSWHLLITLDYKSANILFSGIRSGRVTAKVGALGLVSPAGDRCNAQPYIIRAPKVLLGEACMESSHVSGTCRDVALPDQTLGAKRMGQP